MLIWKFFYRLSSGSEEYFKTWKRKNFDAGNILGFVRGVGRSAGSYPRFDKQRSFVAGTYSLVRRI